MTCMLAALLMSTTATESAPGVIVDTDFRSDVDDVGTLALLNVFADRGECDLVGVVASQTGPHIVSAINAVNTWYGRGDVPIALSPVDDQRFPDPYAPTIGDPGQYPSTQQNATAPDSTTLYRRLLHASPDKSVRIIVIGGQTCVRLLLDSEADHEGDGSINRTGRELIETKVESLYCMAGNFENPDAPEHNINLDLEAAQRVAADWPTPIVYSGFEVGDDVMTGGAFENPRRNPVAKAYELYPPAGGVGEVADSRSFDQTMAWYAVRGPMGGGVRLWEVSEPGRVSFPEGLTRFEPDPAGPHRYLIPAAPDETVADAIEAVMVQQPKAQR